MKILYAFDKNHAPWEKAAKYLGHELQPLNRERVLDSFRGFKPDVVLLGGALTVDPAVLKAVQEMPGLKVAVKRGEKDEPFNIPNNATVVVPIAPADDVRNGGPTMWFPLLDYTSLLPNESPGTYRPEFASDVSYFGPYYPHFERALTEICNSGLNVKLFGAGQMPYHQYLGRLSYEEEKDACASARLTIVAKGDTNRQLDIWAMGGRHYTYHEGTTIEALKQELSVRGMQPTCRGELLSRHTLAHRLRDLLEELN